MGAQTKGRNNERGKKKMTRRVMARTREIRHRGAMMTKAVTCATSIFGQNQRVKQYNVGKPH